MLFSGSDGLPLEALNPAWVGVVLALTLAVWLGWALGARRSGLEKRRQLHLSMAHAREELQQAVEHDPLTRLLNRTGFEARLAQAIGPSASTGNAPCLAVMVLNLDGFQALEDQWGPSLCQPLLRQVGARLRTIVRQGDVVARDERDQFLLLFVQPGDPGAIATLAKRVTDLLAQPFSLEDAELPLTCSIGLSLCPDDCEVGTLMTHAEEAMVMARRSGGAAHCIFQAGMQRDAEQQVLLQSDLRHAVERHELELHYQPKLDAATGAMVGVEALLRWRHPLWGMVGPQVFIPVAERFGLIGELGAWVMREACQQMREWLYQGLRIPVAVNVSVHQLRQSDLEARVRSALGDHQLAPDMLLLEITETVAMENVDFSLAVFDLLASVGVQLSIDDFGTGYSSLSYLRRLPASQLKIDRAFVKDLDGDSPDAAAIVEAVVQLAHALGLQVVAEGVETVAQARRLRALGCDQLQGFLLGRPMPEHELRRWLDEPQRQVLWDSLALAEEPPRVDFHPSLPDPGPGGSPPLSTVS